MGTPLQAELGPPLSVKDVAEILGVDPRTVRKYAEDLGGVWVAGRLRFFDNYIRSLCDASVMQTRRRTPLARPDQKGRPSGRDQVVRSREKGRAGVQKGSCLGGGNQKDPGEPALDDNRYGLLDGLKLGKRPS